MNNNYYRSQNSPGCLGGFVRSLVSLVLSILVLGAFFTVMYYLGFL